VVFIWCGGVFASQLTPAKCSSIIYLINPSPIEFLGIWEQINNPDFNPIEFDGFKKQAGLNSFTITSKQWIERTNAIGLIAKTGRYGGGTFAHKDIAFEFASWVSVEFKLYLIKEFQRLKEDENKRLKLDWNLQRTLAKVNYRIHTDAIKEKLIPSELTDQQIHMVYASEADILNMALFGVTAKQWRDANSSKKGNIRDYAAKEESLMFSDIIKDEEVLLKQIEEEKKFTEYLPVYTLAAACGNFEEGASAEIEGWIKAEGLGRLNRNMFVTKVTGKSMEPLIPDQSYCLFRTPVVGSRNNKIVLVQHNSINDQDTGGKYTVKKYTSKKRQGEDETWVHEEINLLPLNPSYKPIVIPNSEEGEFMVVAEFIKVLC